MDKKFKSILKNNKAVKIASAMILSGVIILGANIATDLQYPVTITQQDAYKLAEQLGANTSYVQQKFGRIGRLQHNDDQPIFVSFSDDISYETKEDTIKALDYMFGIMGDINTNYRYEIVDNVDDLKYLNKTTIEFSSKNFSQNNGDLHTEGLFEHLPNETSFTGSKGVLFKNVNIYLDNNMDNPYYIGLHELAHAFGIGDVYSLDVQNSLTNINFKDFKQPILTPNDYKILWAFYAPEFKSENEMKQYIEKANMYIEEYTKNYYVSVLESQREYNIKTLEDSGRYSEDRIKEITTTTPINDIDVIFDSPINVSVDSIRVKVKNGRYVIAIYNNSMEVINSCKGVAHIIDGEIFLENVALNKFTGNKKFYADLHIALNSHSGEYSLITTSNMEISQHGYNASLESVSGLNK